MTVPASGSLDYCQGFCPSASPRPFPQLPTTPLPPHSNSAIGLSPRYDCLCKQKKQTNKQIEAPFFACLPSRPCLTSPQVAPSVKFAVEATLGERGREANRDRVQLRYCARGGFVFRMGGEADRGRLSGKVLEVYFVLYLKWVTGFQ